jgi:hypothetical protein
MNSEHEEKKVENNENRKMTSEETMIVSDKAKLKNAMNTKRRMEEQQSGRK